MSLAPSYSTSLPETRYARNGGIRIAYQVVEQRAGKPLDLVVVPGLVSHLGLLWDDPDHAHFCRQLSAFARLILFDKRGTGLSDRQHGVPDVQQRMEDVRAVLDAAGADRPAMLGISEGGMMSLLFATTRPERLRALALYGAFALSPTRAWPESQVEARLDLVERTWGVAVMPPSVAPSRAHDREFRRNWARFEQRSASPGAARELLRLSREADMSPVLSKIRVPVLLLHRRGDRRVEIDKSRELAARIPDAKLVELPGEDHLPHIGDSARIATELASFLQPPTPE
ncbi:MAG TPA: alpha/beta fold hydrolase [Stellaceae bacterium]|nr:alpha/beta fold hydrolase [Stellaceae bacterium]